MSIEAIAGAIKLRMTDPLAKMVLLLLANRHNADTNECFPSITRLCEESGMSRRTVIRKLGTLEDMKLIEAQERRREDGTRTSSNYHLSFLVATESNPEKRLKMPVIPPDDWWPRPETIEKLRRGYPHHDTSDATIALIVGEWIDYCHGSGKKFTELDRAWTASAKRWLGRQRVIPSPRTPGGGQRNGVGSVSGALRRFIGEGGGGH